MARGRLPRRPLPRAAGAGGAPLAALGAPRRLGLPPRFGAPLRPRFLTGLLSRL